VSNTWCENPPTPGAASACVVGGFVINEFLADPATDLKGDANGDGTRDASQDELVEIVNNTGADMDISGWTLADGVQVRHTFPAGTVVSDQCAVLVFGGGTPTGAFGNVVVQTASTGLLGLNNGGDTITLSDGSIDRATVTYGSEGGDDQSLTLDPDITGSSFVKHSVATGSGGTLFSPGTMIDGSSFAGCVSFGACGDPATFIHAIQGSGAASPEVGNTHVIEGVVVGDFQDATTRLGGFFVQEEDGDADSDPATSEGIFVYDGTFGVDVNEGDVVRVAGKVAEYYDLTEINNVALVLTCGSDTLAPTDVDLPVDVDLEPYEGMLVTFPETLTASQNYFQGRYGQVTLSSEGVLEPGGRLFIPTNTYRPLTPEAIAMADENWRRMIILDDGQDVSPSGDNPDPIPYIGEDNTLRAGDTVVGLTGVIDYGLISSTGNYYYRLQPTVDPITFTRVNERTEAPEDVGGVLKIAAFNVLNYFNGDGMGGGFPTSRGADTPEEFDRQRTKIFAAILALDADVVGLMEIENDGYDEYSAIQDLVNGLNNIAGAGTYAFIDPGVAPVGTDEIAVGLIYNATTVAPVGEAQILDDLVDPDFLSEYNRPVIAQTFEITPTGGARFTAAVNHLKSKGSPCDSIGDPDTGDGQGNCNLTRTAGAEALVNWLAGDPTGSEDDDFFIIGDLNAYAMEDPIMAIEAASYTNLVKAFKGTWEYSYTFDGQAGYLDHSLASANAVAQVMGATVWHINTDEPAVIDYDLDSKPQDLYTPTPYRASDHDPVLVGFCEGIPPVLEVSVTPDTLWPPNHKYVTVQATVTFWDNFDPNPTLELVSVTSNEPDNGDDDGDTIDDIVIHDDFTFELRAERSGIGDGRIYTITYQATDACGNSTVATVTVTVPHD
jgi:predicted extracellular nuclease